MADFPRSLREFQRWFPDDEAVSSPRRFRGGLLGQRLIAGEIAVPGGEPHGIREIERDQDDKASGRHQLAGEGALHFKAQAAYRGAENGEYRGDDQRRFAVRLQAMRDVDRHGRRAP